MRKEIIKDAIDSLIYGQMEGRKERMIEIMRITDKNEKLKQYKKEMGSYGGMSGKDGYFYDHDSQGDISIRKGNEEYKVTAVQIINLKTLNLFN